MNKMSSSQARFSWKQIIPWAIIGTVGLVLWLALGSEGCGNLFNILIGLWWLAQFFGWLFKHKEDVGAVLGGVIILGIVAAIGYLLWIVVSWLFQSTGLWWTWFSGHF